MNTIVHEMVVRGKQYLENLNYSQGSKKIYHQVWGQFERFCHKENLNEPTRSDGEAFLAGRGISPNVKLTVWQRNQNRAVNSLFDIWESGECPLKYGVKRFPLPECFEHIHEAYSNHLGTQGLSARTIYGKNCHARKFLNYIDSIGIHNIGGVCRENIYDYLSMIKSQQTKSGIKFFLREFLRFLVSGFGAEPDLANLFPVILENKKDTLPSVYSAEELSETLKQLDENSRCAKRSRAILVLAMQLGMRAGDIVYLKHEHIDWRLRKLSFTQQKTKRKIVLPLPEECMFALLDYLKNERPQVDDPHVFLTSRAPYKPFAACNTYYGIISECYERAGVDTRHKHRGLHSVRHSMAVNMLLSDTPYPVITGVLGHESSNTTKAYLRVDVERLRALCLEVPHVC